VCVKPDAMTDRVVSDSIVSTAEIKVLQDYKAR